jgi:hypothetical protein
MRSLPPAPASAPPPSLATASQRRAPSLPESPLEHRRDLDRIRVSDQGEAAPQQRDGTRTVRRPPRGPDSAGIRSSTGTNRAGSRVSRTEIGAMVASLPELPLIARSPPRPRGRDPLGPHPGRVAPEPAGPPHGASAARLRSPAGVRGVTCEKSRPTVPLPTMARRG